jgi:hypothetical protein
LAENVVDRRKEDVPLVKEVYYVKDVGLHENAPQNEILLIDIEQGDGSPQGAAAISTVKSD